MQDNNDSSTKLPLILSREGELIPASGGGGGGSDDYIRGLRDGVSIGVQAGYEYAIDRVKEIIPELVQQAISELPDIKKALSDGLRHGSPDCGKALVEHYRYKKSGNYLN
ncbi:hypothetical protein ES815_23060 [Leclercia adecarboxylata]|uniref:Uncharacterized protein n=1 Tax=Leclercia adecarboxylata TaxID=83655 RepID=A0AAP9DDX3_9ENTR|nr:hypothetical protein [Leclercia adecarboxylata]QDK21030.1 hypothetical protein ES815_23060 [Leclercia adecarboxylata]